MALIVAGLLWAVDRPTERTGLLLALGTSVVHAGLDRVAQRAARDPHFGDADPACLPAAGVSCRRVDLRRREATACGYHSALSPRRRTTLAWPCPCPRHGSTHRSGCWNNCTDNVLLVTSQPWLARMLADTWIAVSVAAGLTLAAGSLWRLRTATRTARRLMWLVTVPASLLGVSLAVHGIALAATPPENPNDPLYAAIFQVEAWSVVALAAGAASGVLRARWARRALRNLAKELGAAPKPGSLAPVLARATGDPSLEVAYWLPDSHRFVNGFGEEVLVPDRDSRRAIAQIVRDGEPIADHQPRPRAREPQRVGTGDWSSSKTGDRQ